MANVKRILVATDLSDRSERAFDRGIRLGRERAATVDLLHVVEEASSGTSRLRHSAVSGWLAVARENVAAMATGTWRWAPERHPNPLPTAGNRKR